MQLKDYISNNLNEEQTAAALHTTTSSLIIAGAGSGKTRVLTYKIAYLIWGLNIPVERILAVTFTNKAANEMKERLIKLGTDIGSQNFSEEKENNENINNDESLNVFLTAIQSDKTIKKEYNLNPQKLKRIGTFHSIFLKILKEDIEELGKKYTKNFGIIDTDDSGKIIKNLIKKYNVKELFKPQEVKAFISNEKNNGKTASESILNANNAKDNGLCKIYLDYEKELEKSNSLDFDDLLLIPYLLFKKNPKILEKRQKKFQFILVDEAQDTNRIQFELMKMLTGSGANITLIGDDFQSIYGRRGAIMENFLNVKRYWPDIKMFKLQTNYRSKPHIVAAGNHVIKNNKHQYEKDIKANRQGNDKITVLTHNNEIEEAENIVELLKQMKNKEKFRTRGQVAILYRTNSQSQVFESYFLKNNIPYKIFGAFKFFERKEIKDILAYLKIITNPFDSVSLERILNIPNRKIGQTTQERIETYASEMGVSLYEVLTFISEINNAKILEQENNLKVTTAAITGINNLITTYNELTATVNELEPSDFIRMLLNKIDYKEYLKNEEHNDQIVDERYENVGQLVNMANKYRFGMTTPENDEAITSGKELLRLFLEEVTLMVDLIDNADDTTEAIKLMTIHASKGLEFPIVIIAGAEENIFPLSNSLLDPKELEEERRLMYVAITRAKDVLFLSHANTRMRWGQISCNSESRFLHEIPEELLKFYDLTQNSGPRENTGITEGDRVKHKLFGEGYVVEVWNNLGMIRFNNPKFGLRKIELKYLEVI